MPSGNMSDIKKIGNGAPERIWCSPTPSGPRPGEVRLDRSSSLARFTQGAQDGDLPPISSNLTRKVPRSPRGLRLRRRASLIKPSP